MAKSTNRLSPWKLPVIAKKIAADLTEVVASAELSDWFSLAHEHASSEEAGAHG